MRSKLKTIAVSIAIISVMNLFTLFVILITLIELQYNPVRFNFIKYYCRFTMLFLLTGIFSTIIIIRKEILELLKTKHHGKR